MLQASNHTCFEGSFHPTTNGDASPEMKTDVSPNNSNKEQDSFLLAKLKFAQRTKSNGGDSSKESSPSFAFTRQRNLQRTHSMTSTDSPAKSGEDVLMGFDSVIQKLRVGLNSKAQIKKSLISLVKCESKPSIADSEEEDNNRHSFHSESSENSLKEDKLVEKCKIFEDSPSDMKNDLFSDVMEMKVTRKLVRRGSILRNSNSEAKDEQNPKRREKKSVTWKVRFAESREEEAVEPSNID